MDVRVILIVWIDGGRDSRVCYYELVQGDTCALSDGDNDNHIDAVTNRNNMTNTGNQKNISCLASEISSIIQTDMQNLKPRPTPEPARLRGRPTRQSDEVEDQRFHVGDVVEFMTLEITPAPASEVFYPCIIRSLLHEVGDDGSVLLKYKVERLMDGFHATVPQDNLKPYEKYDNGANNVLCRKWKPNAVSQSSFQNCRIVGDHFPDWIIEHSDPHTRAESFLNGQYKVVYTDSLGEVCQIPAHDTFSFKYHF